MFKILSAVKQKVLLFLKIYVKNNFNMIDIWFWISGDNNLRINYPLNENSLVLDVGGYKGEWAKKIFTLYKSNIIIFEPVKHHFNYINEKFKNNSKIQLQNVALGASTCLKKIYLNNNGSSTNIIHSSNNFETISVININDFIEDNNINKVDLMKINIEGDEYELLELLINTKKIKIFSNIQVQFHHWIDNAAERREKIRSELIKTHCETYSFPFIWENWQIKR